MPTPTSTHTLWLDFAGRAGTCQDTLSDYIEGNWILRDELGLLGMGLGGEGGIRTHDTLSRIPVFETGTFNRSVTSPGGRILPAGRISAPDRSPSRGPCRAAARKDYLCPRRRADSPPGP